MRKSSSWYNTHSKYSLLRLTFRSGIRKSSSICSMSILPNLLTLRYTLCISFLDNEGLRFLERGYTNFHLTLYHVARLCKYQGQHKFTHADLNTRHRHIHTRDGSMYGTTVLCVRKDSTVVIFADGQVTMGSQIIKPNVRKVRRIGDSVIGGFAGATADAFTLFETLENKLEEHPGQLTRAAVELAKAWRMDKFLRRLDAVMVVADGDTSLTITGTGDVLEPYDGIIGIGSGGPYASAAARALIDLPDMDAETIARKAMKIAADTCIYTNHNFTMEKIGLVGNSEKSPTATI